MKSFTALILSLLALSVFVSSGADAQSPPSELIQIIEWSPDGSRLALVSHSGVRILNNDSVEQFMYPAPYASDVAWSPDGTQLAVSIGYHNGVVTLIDPDNGSPLFTLQNYGQADRVVSLSWSADGTKIAGAAAKYTGSVAEEWVTIWDTTTGDWLQTIPRKSDSVAWSPDGDRIALGSNVYSTRIIDVSTGEVLVQFEDETSDSIALAWNPDGTLIATGDAIGLVYVWNTTTGDLVETFETTNGVRSLDWSPEGDFLVSGSYRQLAVWDISSGRSILTLDVYSGPRVAWSPDGAQIAYGGEDGQLHIIPAPEVTSPPTAPASENTANPIYHLSWSPDGTNIAIGYLEFVEVQNVSSSQVTLTFSAEHVSDVEWSPVDDRIALATKSFIEDVAIITIIDSITGETLVELDADDPPPGLSVVGGADQISSIAWSPDGTLLAAGVSKYSGSVRETWTQIWDTSNGNNLASRHETSDDIAWSPDGNYIVRSSVSGRASIVGLTQETNLVLEDQNVITIAWSPDGNYVGTGNISGEVNIWDSSSGNRFQTYSPARFVYEIAWNPDSTMIASVSGSKLNIWNVASGENTFNNSLEQVALAIAWNPNGNTIAYGGEDGQLHIIPAPEAKTAPDDTNSTENDRR